MALSDLIQRKNIKQEITEEYLIKEKDKIRKYIAFWRAYPDLFVDYINQPNTTNFHFHPYQRIFIRCLMRYRECFITAPRGASKSFLAFLTLILKCILYPGVNLFATTDQKNQAAAILNQSVSSVLSLIPALSKEINWARGVTRKGGENVNIVFKNGSQLNILPPVESSRGARRIGGVIEEIATVDGDALNQIIFPTMTVTRRLADGSKADEEVINSSCEMITTAGLKTTYAYEKLMELLVKQITQQDNNAMTFGCSWRIPQKANQYAAGYIQGLKLSGTYTDETFYREFDSAWSGSIEDSFFSPVKFDKSRVLLEAEDCYNRSAMKDDKTAYYVMGVDVGRLRCTTEICVFRVVPHPGEASIKKLVMCISLPEADFETQAIKLKQTFLAYKCKIMVLDTNGVGQGLMDIMIKEQRDPDTHEILPPFFPENDDGSRTDGKKMYPDIPPNAVLNAIFMMKADAAINTEAHTYCKANLGTNSLQLLIDEQEASQRLMETKKGQDMTPEQRAAYLMPYTLTTALREQMMNLQDVSDGKDIKLKAVSKKLGKDRFSAFEYGIWWVQKRDMAAKKKKGRFSDFMFSTKID